MDKRYELLVTGRARLVISDYVHREILKGLLTWLPRTIVKVPIPFSSPSLSLSLFRFPRPFDLSFSLFRVSASFVPRISYPWRVPSTVERRAWSAMRTRGLDGGRVQHAWVMRHAAWTRVRPFLRLRRSLSAILYFFVLVTRHLPYFTCKKRRIVGTFSRVCRFRSPSIRESANLKWRFLQN